MPNINDDLLGELESRVSEFTYMLTVLRGKKFADAQALKVLEEAQEFDDALLESKEEREELYDVIITALVYLVGVHNDTIYSALKGVLYKMRENTDNRVWIVKDDGTVHNAGMEPIDGSGPWHTTYGTNNLADVRVGCIKASKMDKSYRMDCLNAYNEMPDKFPFTNKGITNG